jgi:tetratricopeptide (TPR) repeat protein
LNESLDVHRGLGEDFRIAQVWAEQGSLLLRLGRQLDEAEIRLKQAGDRFRRYGNVYYHASVLASLCELCYKRKDYDGVYQIAKEAGSIDNGLIDYFFGKIGLVVGKTHFDQGRPAEAIDALCAASERALSFNAQSFEELHGEILVEADHVAREIAPETAVQLCESYEEFWQNRDLGSIERESVARLLQAVRRKREAVKALTPVGANGVGSRSLTG